MDSVLFVKPNVTIIRPSILSGTYHVVYKDEDVYYCIAAPDKCVDPWDAAASEKHCRELCAIELQ